MKLTLLTTFDDTVSANILKTKLESENIPCFLHNENLTGLLPNAQNVMGSGVRVLVPEELLHNAIKIAELGQQKNLCPDCGSDQLVNISEQKRKKFKLLFTLIAGILVDPPSKYSCTNCGYLFKR